MGAVLLATEPVDDERHAGTIPLRDTGDYAIITLPNGIVRIWLDVDRVVADIQTASGGHVISTWASFDEMTEPKD